MKKAFTLFLILIYSLSLFAQKHDFDWMVGIMNATAPGNTELGTTHLDFNSLPVNVYREETDFGFEFCNISMSDENGNLLFYSNCSDIFNTEGQLMLNSVGFNQHTFHDIYPDGLPLAQGVLGLKGPSTQDTYYVLHQKFEFGEINGTTNAFGVGLYFTVIDMEGDAGLGEVVEKGLPIVEDTLARGTLTATRHANGRDWWVIVPAYNSNEYYRALLGPGGVVLQDIQTVGEPTISGLGQAAFSPDGSVYVRNSILGGAVGDDYLDIYDFDRCTGLLGDHVRFTYGSGVSAGGVAVSNNNRFVYVSHRNHVYQYDLWAPDIEASKDTIAVYDGFLDGGFNPTSFFLAQSAPDGKIYLNTTTGTHWLHTVHSPDEPGDGCNFEQRGLYLPTINFFSLPNFPNYRLGPLDGSLCDTLGLDNLPVAKYRYDQDTLDPLKVAFTDLSYYGPTEWEWDFGGTGTSTEKHPLYTFPSDGTYEVCLTVRNDNGEDTFCRTLQLGTVLTDEIKEEIGVTIFPNPAKEGLNLIVSDDYLPREGKFIFYDVMGQVKLSRPVLAGWNSILLDGISSGIYFYIVKDGPTIMGSGKLVVE